MLIELLVNIVVLYLNRQTVINKFIEKAGELDPKPQYGYIQGKIKGNYGLTTNLDIVLSLWRNRYKKENGIFPQDVTSSVPDKILPKIHYEINDIVVDFDESDLLNCMRCLQNSPFSKITVFHWPNKALPIAFHRSDCDISILLAPIMLPIKPEAPVMPESKYKGNPWIDKAHAEWKYVSDIPNTTFQLWTFDLTSTNPPWKPDSVLAMTWGYPIAKMLKCRNCKFEIGIQDWVTKKIQWNHPECQCSCNTYDDFCGCRKRREFAAYDRLAFQTRQRYRFMRNHWDVA